MPLQSFLERAGCWFLHSGIQEPSGGVARYYRVDLRANASVSTEITGYAVSAFTYLYSRTASEEYLYRANTAATFLVRSAWNEDLSAMPFECGDGRALTYFFDCGIIIRGLVRLYQVTGESEWLRVAERCGQSMQRDFTAHDGRYHPILSLPLKTPVPPDERWSRNSGCYQLKAALGWLELGRATANDDWDRLFENVLSYALATHVEFLTREDHRDRIMDRLHAYCYFLEGLIPCLNRDECRAVLRDGIALTARLLRDVSPDFARSDVYAQLLRLRLYADAAGIVPLDRTAAEEEVSWLAAFQMESPDTRERGSFCFGRKGSTPLPYANPVSTVFGLQALLMWNDYLGGHKPSDAQALI